MKATTLGLALVTVTVAGSGCLRDDSAARQSDIGEPLPPPPPPPPAPGGAGGAGGAGDAGSATGAISAFGEGDGGVDLGFNDLPADGALDSALDGGVEGVHWGATGTGASMTSTHDIAGDLRTRGGSTATPVLDTLVLRGITVSPGARGREVRDAQLLLKAQGFLPAYAEEGVMDQETVEAVEAFQRSRGINVDGVVGPNTLLALHDTSVRWGAPQETRTSDEAFGFDDNPPR